MNTHRYSEEQRKQWVKDKFTRAKTVRQICREASISRATLYNWIEEFKDLGKDWKERDDASAKAVKASKPELLFKSSPETTERYKMLVAALSGIDPEKTISKKLVAVLIKRFTLTVAQACAVVGMDEAAYGYKPRKPEVEDYIVYEALVNLIHEDRTREFETLYDMLLQQHPDWTRKQIKRVYRDGMVYLERKRSNIRWEKLGKARTQQKESKLPPAHQAATPRIQKAGGTWNLALLEYASSLDGVSTNWWMLCIVDEESGLQLNATAGVGTITTEDLLAFLDKAAAENGLPRKLKVPGKPPLTVRELTRWVWQHKMALHTFSLNKPENLDAVNGMEQSVLESLRFGEINTREALFSAAENWIAKPELV